MRHDAVRMTPHTSPDDLIVQSPEDRPARLLIALHHGMGSSARAMLPLGRLLAQAFADAAIVSVAAPFESDTGRGYQWFSARGVTDDNRMARIEAVMPRFVERMQSLQARFGSLPAATVLAGFSQGGILSLESARAGQGLASRIVAIGARFAHLPQTWPDPACIHLVHGDDDPVIPVSHAVDAASRLAQLGARVTLDRFAGTGHDTSAAMAQCIVERLQAAAPPAA